MKVSIPKMKSEYRVIGFVAVDSLIMVLLLAGAALGDAIDDGLPANSRKRSRPAPGRRLKAV